MTHLHFLSIPNQPFISLPILTFICLVSLQPVLPYRSVFFPYLSFHFFLPLLAPSITLNAFMYPTVSGVDEKWPRDGQSQQDSFVLAAFLWEQSLVILHMGHAVHILAIDTWMRMTVLSHGKERT